MQFKIIFFISAFALANAGVIVQDHHVVDTPFEKTSIIGPSGSITQEKNVPPVDTKSQEIESSAKVTEPASVEPSVVPVAKEVSLPKAETVAPVDNDMAMSEKVPVLKAIATEVPEYPVFPAWYSYPWFRSYYPYYNYYTHYLI